MDLDKYLDDFYKARISLLKKCEISMDSNKSEIQIEINKNIKAEEVIENKSCNLINKLNNIIVNFSSINDVDLNLILYMKRYFELHNFLYSEFNFIERKFDTTSMKNKIDVLHKTSYLLQLLYIKNDDFNYLSTSIKINDFILENFAIEVIISSPYIKHLICHEILILKKI